METYDLRNLNRDLLAERENGASLRDLADHVNRRVLEAGLERADANLSNVAFGAVPDEDAVGAIHEALDGTDVPVQTEARVRTLLNGTGLDVDELQSDWVTHPTVRSHLRNCLGRDTARKPDLAIDDGRDTVEWARAQCEGIVEQTLQRLQSADRVSAGTVDVTVSISVSCRDCGQMSRATELLDERGCECSRDWS